MIPSCSVFQRKPEGRANYYVNHRREKLPGIWKKLIFTDMWKILNAFQKRFSGFWRQWLAASVPEHIQAGSVKFLKPAMFDLQ